MRSQREFVPRELKGIGGTLGSIGWHSQAFQKAGERGFVVQIPDQQIMGNSILIRSEYECSIITMHLAICICSISVK